MKRNVRVILNVFLCAVMILGMTACGSGEKVAAVTSTQSVSTAAAGVENTAAEPSTEPAVAEPVTLKLWHMFVSDGDGNTKPFKAVLEHAGQQLTDVRLEVDGVDNESYKTKIKTAIAANDAPDIFFTWAAGFSKPFVDSGKVLCLDNYLGDIKDKLLPGITTNLTYDGKVYGLPFQMQVGALFCNREIFDANGVKLPETYEDLLAVVKTFSAKGITPMTCGAADKWPAMWYYDILALRTAGAQLCNDALNKKASFNSQEFTDAAAKLDELSKAGAFGKNALGTSWDESQIAFAQGKAAMIFNGNWVAGLAEGDTSSVKGKVVAVKFPTITGGKGTNTEYFGGSGDGFMVSANSVDKDMAVKTVKFICEDMARESYLAGSGMPGWKVDVDDSKVSPLVKQLVAMTKDATGWVLWWDVFLEGADADTHKNLATEVLAGTRTPEQYSEEMQKLSEK
jgi:raffinose/stachyose/melibiose transport system substrate-binding protein